MMSARPPVTFAEHHYLSPASTASDSATSWASMPPFQYPNAPRQHQRKSLSPANESESMDGGFMFITGNKPADFKKKRVMTQVRKKAMGSYLEKEKKPRRDSREPSTGSRTSIGSDQQDALDTIIANDEALKIFRGESRRPPRRPSSPVLSPASSNHDQHSTTSSETQISRLPPALDMSILESAPMFRAPRLGVKLAYDETSPRPFVSIGKPLDPFQTLYQSSHPRVSVESLKYHCSQMFGTRAMGQYWIPSITTSPHAFLSTLCIASAHYDAVNNRPVESVQTLALRQEVIHLIGQNLVNPSSRVDDSNVIALTQLIASEIISGEDSSLNYHESGVDAMIRVRGGVNRLGINGRLASTLSWVSLESSILREAKPRTIYTDYCTSKSSKSYPSTATIPESPLFCPRKDLETIKRSSRCSSKTLDLLKKIRTMMEFFSHETKHSRQNSTSLKNIYKEIAGLPQAADLQKTNILNASDWTYEAIRIAAVIQATAILRRVSLSEALKYAAQSSNNNSLYSSSNASRSSESLVSPTAMRHDSPFTSFSTSPSYVTAVGSNPFDYVPQPGQSKLSVSSTATDFSFFPPPAPPTLSGPNDLLTKLRTALDHSDISHAWNDMAGVLLWIALVAGTASRKSDKTLKKWYSALAVRISILLCFEHPEAIHSTLLRMGEFVEALGYPAQNEEVTRRTSSITNRTENSMAEGKRRKV